MAYSLRITRALLAGGTNKALPNHNAPPLPAQRDIASRIAPAIHASPLSNIDLAFACLGWLLTCNARIALACLRCLACLHPTLACA